MSDRTPTESLENVTAQESRGLAFGGFDTGKAGLDQVRALQSDLDSGRELKAKGLLPTLELFDSKATTQVAEVPDKGPDVPHASDAMNGGQPANKLARQFPDDIHAAHRDQSQLDRLAEQLQESPQWSAGLRRANEVVPNAEAQLIKLLESDQHEATNLADSEVHSLRVMKGNSHVEIHEHKVTRVTYDDGRARDFDYEHGDLKRVTNEPSGNYLQRLDDGTWNMYTKDGNYLGSMGKAHMNVDKRGNFVVDTEDGQREYIFYAPGEEKKSAGAAKVDVLESPATTDTEVLERNASPKATLAKASDFGVTGVPDKTFYVSTGQTDANLVDATTNIAKKAHDDPSRNMYDITDLGNGAYSYWDKDHTKITVDESKTKGKITVTGIDKDGNHIQDITLTKDLKDKNGTTLLHAGSTIHDNIDAGVQVTRDPVAGRTETLTRKATSATPANFSYVEFDKGNVAAENVWHDHGVTAWKDRSGKWHQGAPPRSGSRK